MHLFLKTLMGQFIGINVENINTVTSMDIKKLIQKKRKVDCSEQTLIIAGRTWEDNLTYPEFREKNPHLPTDLNINHIKLVITPIPIPLRPFVRLNYHELKELSPQLTNQLSRDSRPLRFTEELHISTQTYWNDLSLHERVKVLSNPDYAQMISSLSTKEIDAMQNNRNNMM
ncbi:hypothetical protein [uncultured Legionella sp.]|uniref:hypothetical protein n=1 Tax=uncultured Legionella sp. TaxID=210934 RepID=UPI0026166FAD|nr:hypothetical protein [uncultured Legionella sp.]